MDNFFSLDACSGPIHVTSFSCHRPSKILFSVVKTSIYRCICIQICIKHICKTSFVTEAINSEDCINANSHAVEIEVIFFSPIDSLSISKWVENRGRIHRKFALIFLQIFPQIFAQIFFSPKICTNICKNICAKIFRPKIFC